MLHFIKRTIKRIIQLFVPQHITVAKISSLPQSQMLEGRHALITGGTSGIGLAIAHSFLNAGAIVTITGRNEHKLKDAISELLTEHSAGGKVFGFVLNNEDVPSFPSVFEQVRNAMGGVDILVNNAGTHGGHISSVTEEQYDTIMNTNLKGAFFLSKIVAKYMKENNIEGNILNIASSSSLRPADSAYTLSKWGIRGLTEGLARSLAPYGIVVNGVAPGPTATKMLNRNDSDLYWPQNLTKRMAHPVEIANIATVLVSNMGRMILGDIVYMSGGGGNITNEDVTYFFD